MPRRVTSCKQEREALKAFYNSPEWAKKVNAMTDKTVIAILNRLQNQGRRAA